MVFYGDGQITTENFTGYFNEPERPGMSLFIDSSDMKSPTVMPVIL